MQYLFTLVLAFVVSSPVLAATLSLTDNPQVKLFDTRLSPDQQIVAAALIDGDTKTVLKPISEEFEFIIELPELASPQAIVVHLRKSKGAKGSVEIELWGSIESPDSGYQILRAVTIRTNQIKASFKFLPTAARWLMIRVSPGADAVSLPLAEIDVRGEMGAPTSKYAFQDSPADAHAVLTKLRSALTLELSEAEESMLADAADGVLDTWSLGDAALLASGVVNEQQRRRYQDRIDQLEKSAKKETAKAGDAMSRGQLLLKRLHRDVLKTGYVEHQTDVSVLLDKGTYNCVSSAVMFGILAERLNIDVRGIEVPEHAYAIVYDGTRHSDVETTSSAGFDPARNRAALKAFTQRTGFAYIPDSKASQRRETSLLGLVALIYYNHGVGHSRAGRNEQALLAYYRALSLDAKLVSAVKNSLVSLNDWAKARADEDDFEHANSLFEVGLALAPKDHLLRHNRRVVWQKRISHAVQQGSPEQVLVIVNAAHASDPDAGFDRQQATLYIQQGRALAEGGQWAEAIAVTAPGRDKVNGASLRSLERFQASVLSRWLIASIDAERWPDALTAATKAHAYLPADGRVRQNVAYLLQEWGEHAATNEGVEAGVEAARSVLDLYPKAYQVKRAARSFVMRRMQDLKGHTDLSEAIRIAKQSVALLPVKRDQLEMLGALVSARARPYVEARQWQEASNVYKQAVAQLPDDKNRTYLKNLPFIAQEWLRDAGDAGDTIARELLTHFGDARKVRQVVSAHYQRTVVARNKAGDFEGSIRVAADAQSVLGDSAASKKLIRIAFDRWAAHLRKQKDWSAATVAYEQALQLSPGDAKLKRNAVATWHAWAKLHLDDKQWQKAIDVYERGLEKLPNTSLFKKNIRYCEQQLARQ